MYLLYVDESGNYSERTDHFAVGGLAIHERDLNRFRKQTREVLAKHLDPHLRGLEIHAQHIRSGRGPWRGIPRAVREALLADLCRLAAGFYDRRHTQPFALFSVIASPDAVPSVDLLERCFEELFLRYNQFLIRQNDHGPGPSGLIIADKAKYESVLQPITRHWHERGTRFKRLRRIVEVPLFCDSRENLLVQMADLVVHMVYRKYARTDDHYVRILLPGFDTERGTIHGLTHLSPSYRTCPCEACASRRPRDADGTPSLAGRRPRRRPRS